MFQILLGILLMAGITAVLAFFLELAGSYFADYGPCDIDINEGDKQLNVNGGGKLLGALADQGIFIPSACGGRGSCGLCKVVVDSGAGPVLPTETPYLDDKELKNNTRLSCQVKIRENIFIRIPEAFFKIKRFECVVQEISDLTFNMKKLVLKLKNPDVIDFIAGQFVQLEIPPYKGSPDGVQRAYSLAASSSISDSITLFITKVENGLATTYVHDHLKQGDEMSFNGPHGDFQYHESEREMVMVATGSGLAPIMSILLEMAEKKSQRKATLFFGTYDQRGLFYLDVLDEIKKSLPNFTFVPVLSNPPEDGSWKGETGIVTEPVKRLLQTPGEREAYLCGHPLMIDAAVDLFHENGMGDEVIFYDKFA